jgi:S1-C subfamily serine protease
MKGSRIFFFALFFGLVFIWTTSRANWSVRSALAPIFRRAAVWSNPAPVKGAGLSADELNNIDIYKRARLATVYITSTTVQRDFLLQPYTSQNLGSGFVINDDGFILTNFHVITGGRQIQVTMSDQTQYNATRLDIDRSDDLALIKISPRKRIPSLPLGDSDRLQVGQKVLAIGNPFGLEGTLTTGIVSSIGRTIQANEGGRLEGMIQTDAAINGGNSGGPLLDSAASVIGINTAILGEKNIGIGFALPINRAKALLDDYRAGRVTERPHLGASTEFVAGDLAAALNLPERGGLLIQRVEPNSSASAAGLQGAQQVVLIGNDQIGIGGDLIIEADGQPIEREDSMVRILARKRVGDDLDLTVVRNGRTLRVRLKLRRAPFEQGSF